MRRESFTVTGTCTLTLWNVQLTQHALRLPGVVVPGFDSILDVFGDAIGGHVFNSVVHTHAVVSLTRCGCADHVPHLRDGRNGIDALKREKKNKNKKKVLDAPVPS